MTTLGKYELHEQLGKGGFGTVYRATDTSLDREVAIKVLHPQLMVDDEFVHRFRREAKVLASLDTHHIVTIYEMVEFEGHIFIAMRYLPGNSLKTFIENEGKIQFEQALSILSQVSNGLHDAHAKGLVHRDLKPENILFDSHGEAVITDFGLVKAATEGSSFSIDRVIGTPNYIAPEIWASKPATPASDIYALACVFYEMLTGEILFHGDSLVEVMSKHHKDLQLPGKWPEAVPAGIKNVMKKALSKEPETRYQKVDDLVKSLRELIPTKEKQKPEKKKNKSFEQFKKIFKPAGKGIKPSPFPGKDEKQPKKWPYILGGFSIIGVLILVLGWATYWFTAGIFEQRQLIYNDDFQSGGVTTFNPNWNVVVNGNNKSYEAKNYSKTAFIKKEIGPNVFTDGVIQYRFMIVDYDEAIEGSGMEYVFFRINGNTTDDSYTFQIQPSNEFASVDYVHKYGVSWENLDHTSFTVKKNKWYKVRVEVNGNQIKTYINNFLLINTIDSNSHLSSGRLGFQVGPMTTIQFDDIKVWQE